MSSKQYLAGTILTLALTTSLFASNKHSQQYLKCMDGPNASQGVTFAVMECTSQELKVQDKRLNSEYGALKKRLSKVRQKELLTVQRLWLKYRDANCGFYYSSNDTDKGTLNRILAQGCVLDATISRADELELFNELF